jgi:hypothetical protein
MEDAMSQRSRVPLQDGELHEDDFGKALGEVLRESDPVEKGSRGPSDEDDDFNEGESPILAHHLRRKRYEH